MVAFDLRKLEFRSDGLVDSLTLSMAPAIFHENLAREFSNSQRDSRDLTIASISLNPNGFQNAAEFQEVLIDMAFAIKRRLRGGDFFARISDCGFWILLRTDVAGAEKVLVRLDLPRHDDLQINYVARKYLTFEEWIGEVDRLHFA